MTGSLPTLILSGAGEFFAEIPADAQRSATPPPVNLQPESLRKAYDLLRVDAGYAGPAAHAWFGSAGLPHNFVLVERKPVVLRLQAGSVRVGLILFPEATEATLNKTVEAVLDAARSLAAMDVVVGISPWGFRLEGKGLARLSEGVDLLLGAGDGAPFPAEVTTYAPGIVWSRADHYARVVTALELLFFPEGPRPRTWIQGLHFRVREYPLVESVHENTEIKQLLDGVR